MYNWDFKAMKMCASSYISKISMNFYEMWNVGVEMKIGSSFI